MGCVCVCVCVCVCARVCVCLPESSPSCGHQDNSLTAESAPNRRPVGSCRLLTSPAGSFAACLRRRMFSLNPAIILLLIIISWVSVALWEMRSEGKGSECRLEVP